MKEFSNFINRANERVFNDSLMRLIIIEIKLKSGELNGETLLPTYFQSDTNYKGEIYNYTASIKSKLSKKEFEQANDLCLKGSKQNFLMITEIRNWIIKETTIKDCSLSALF